VKKQGGRQSAGQSNHANDREIDLGADEARCHSGGYDHQWCAAVDDREQGAWLEERVVREPETHNENDEVNDDAALRQQPKKLCFPGNSASRWHAHDSFTLLPVISSLER
jgi:hypothetical protein